jgi:hypothetical protein
MHPKLKNILEFSYKYSNTYNCSIPGFSLYDYQLLEKKLSENMDNYHDVYTMMANTLFGDGENINIFEVLNYAIIHSALQYNFWYGSQDYKPFNSGIITEYIIGKDYQKLEDIIKNSVIGFIPDRLETLNNLRTLLSNGYLESRFFAKNFNLHDFIDFLLEQKCFNNDPLFKKGILVIMEVRRILDHWPNKDDSIYRKLDKTFDTVEISTYPIPADYRIPEYLASVGAQTETLNKYVIENSIEEIGIRTTSIRLINELHQISKLPTYVLDSLIFIDHKVNKSESKHHLCMTTNY